MYAGEMKGVKDTPLAITSKIATAVFSPILQKNC